MMRPYFKRHTGPVNRQISWRLDQICLSYVWPKGRAGGGLIGIVELDGGYLPSDLTKLFGSLGQPVPHVTDISVQDGATNTPGSDADAEVALDIQIAAEAYFMGTGQPAQIRVYWADNSDPNAIAKAIDRAASDGCDVFSCSWGADEAAWGKENADTLEAAALAAVTAGMIVFAAAGDNDSADGGPGAANVDLPASAPHVVGCGGTNRPHNSTPANPETVWNNNPGKATGEGTGGGYSTIFQMPEWQSQAGAPAGRGRMVPDVSACADPTTGYRIVLDGQEIVVGGTSAVAPLYAGLFAAFGRKLGFVTPKLWANQSVFHDILAGNNGQYFAQTGPDPCTGLGTPKANHLAMLFS